jgi:hypothetical protein
MAIHGIFHRAQAQFQFTAVKFVLQSILVLGGLGALYERQWVNAVLIAGIIFLTLLPALVRMRFSINIPLEFELLAIAFVFASIFLGEFMDYYARFWWWDLVLHLGSGLLFGLFGFIVVYLLHGEERVPLRLNPFFLALFAFAFALAMGALWEIFEFAMDRSFGTNMQKSGLDDTMGDLIVDAFGAFAVAALGWSYIVTGERSPVAALIEGFKRRNPDFLSRFRSTGTGDRP